VFLPNNQQKIQQEKEEERIETKIVLLQQQLQIFTDK
jgi:hypothetical protein